MKSQNPISWWQILIATFVGMVTLLSVGYLGWRAAGTPPYGSWGDLARSVPLVFAAIGALPAGYIAYRRQRTLERQRNDDRDKYLLADSTEGRLSKAEQTRIDELANANRREDARAFQARYTEVAAQLGSDKAAVRLAGVHAAGKLIDDWGEFDSSQRQMCVDLLCGYMCLPLPHEDSTTQDEGQSEETLAEIRVRETAVRVLKHRLSNDRGLGGLVFDFTGSVFPAGHWDFAGAGFDGGALRMSRVTFANGALVSFANAEFLDCEVDFRGAVFALGCLVDVTCATFAGEREAWFTDLTVNGGYLNLGGADVKSAINFRGTIINRGAVSLGGAKLRAGGSVSFNEVQLNAGRVSLDGANVGDRATVTFDRLRRGGGAVTAANITGDRNAVTADGKPFLGTN